MTPRAPSLYREGSEPVEEEKERESARERERSLDQKRTRQTNEMHWLIMPENFFAMLLTPMISGHTLPVASSLTLNLKRSLLRQSMVQVGSLMWPAALGHP